jgi:hypothetical protein
LFCREVASPESSCVGGTCLDSVSLCDSNTGVSLLLRLWVFVIRCAYYWLVYFLFVFFLHFVFAGVANHVVATSFVSVVVRWLFLLVT